MLGIGFTEVLVIAEASAPKWLLVCCACMLERLPFSLGKPGSVPIEILGGLPRRDACLRARMGRDPGDLVVSILGLQPLEECGQPAMREACGVQHLDGAAVGRGLVFLRRSALAQGA